MAKNKLPVTINGNTEFMAQGGWIAKALMDKNSVLGFFVQFQYAFGVFANPKGKDMTKFEGLHISMKQMEAAWKDAGWQKMSYDTIKDNLKVLVEVGAISKASVTPHPNSPTIYVINEGSPHQHQALVEKLAAKQLEISPYKDQAKNSAAKKEREAIRVVTPHEEVAAKVSQILPKALPYVRTHLEQGGNVFEAYGALKNIKSENRKVTQGTFDIGIKKFRSNDVPLSMDDKAMLKPLRDELLQIELDERKETQDLKVAQHQANVLEQRKIDQARIAATPKPVIKAPTDEDIMAGMSDLLDSLDL